MTLSKFTYGVAYNLTLLDQANSAELKWLDISKSQRNKALEKSYRTKFDATLQSDAQYVVEFDKKTGHVFEEKYLYGPSANSKDMLANIEVAGHEIHHGMTFQDRRSNKKWSVIAGTLAAGAVGWLTKSWIAGISTGGVVGFGLTKFSEYMDEEDCYEYQKKVHCFYQMPKPGQTHSVLLLDQYTTKKQLTEKFVKGYPCAEKIQLIQYEQQQSFLKNASLWDPKRQQRLLDATQKNLMNNKFNLRQL